jgi:hypothetical protein
MRALVRSLVDQRSNLRGDTNALTFGVRGTFPAVCNNGKKLAKFWAAGRQATNHPGRAGSVFLSPQQPSVLSLTPTQPRN